MWRLRTVLLCLFVGVPSIVHAAIPATERQALIDFYNATGGTAWTSHSNWNGPAGSECSWEGVACNDGSTHVVRIQLPGHGLTGAFPPSLLRLLLSVIDLSNNHLAGPLPDLSAMTSLQDVFLGINAFTGPIPPLPSNLRSLNLANNKLTGGLPQSLPQFLSAVGLSYNQLTGTIPRWSGSQLTSVVLSHNGLTGTLPVFNAPSLLLLDVSENALSGSIAAVPYPKLYSLELTSNAFSGSLPALFIPELRFIEVRGNHFSGSLPSFSGVPLLEVLSAHGNAFTGSLPDLAQVPHLLSLDLSNNHLSGPFFTIPQNNDLQVLDLSSNALTGAIPPSVLNFRGTRLYTHYNGLYSGSADVTAFLEVLERRWSETQTVAPDPFSAAQTGQSNILLSWPSKLNGFPRYEVQWSEDGGPFVTVSQDDLKSNSMNITGTVGHAYRFRVRMITEAWDFNDNRIVSEYSRPAGITLLQDVPPYPIPTLALTPMWVDAAHGNDQASGLTRATAIRSIGEAARRLQSGSGGAEILLTAGMHAVSTVAIKYYGSSSAPLIIRPADGGGTATINIAAGGGLSIENSSSVYLLDLAIRGAGVPTVGIKYSRDIVVRNCTLPYLYPYSVENVFIEHSSMQHLSIDEGHWVNVTDSTISTGQTGDCLYAGSSSANLRFERNVIGPCRSAVSFGEGAPLTPFTSPPFIHYDVTGLRFVNNTVFDTTSSMLSIAGTYDALVANNTFVGTAGHTALIDVRLGVRSCSDGYCAQLKAMGGWEPAADGLLLIPSRNVVVVNNIVRAQGAPPELIHVDAPSSAPTQSGTGVPVPTRADDGLIIAGNVFWAGACPLLLGGGCADSGTQCSAASITATNYVRTIDPQFFNRAGHDFHPLGGGNLFGLTPATVPDFTWLDAPLTPAPPRGETSATIYSDADNQARLIAVPGAFIVPMSPRRRQDVAH